MAATAEGGGEAGSRTPEANSPKSEAAGGKSVANGGSSSSALVASDFLEPLNHQVQETMEQFEMFSIRKPRNLMAGTSSGLKSVYSDKF